jgi:hypothetical protein
VSTDTTSSRLSDLARQKRDTRVRGRYDSGADDRRQPPALGRRRRPVGRGRQQPAGPPILRNRARYEVANNSYLAGILDTLANDTIGTGPRLQMLTGEEALDSTIEEEFADWADEIDLAEKLRTLRRARCESGEVLAMFVTNPGLASRVKLDVVLVEADQLTDPTWQSVSDPNWCDGIRFDVFGNPRATGSSATTPAPSPGAPTRWNTTTSRRGWCFTTSRRPPWAAARHPGDHAGAVELAGAAPLLQAVIAAAETAADYAMTIQSEAGATTATRTRRRWTRSSCRSAWPPSCPRAGR